jgi:hypothetical protein
MAAFHLPGAGLVKLSEEQMDRSANKIAEEALPGWKVIKGRNRQKVSRAGRASLATPDLAELRMRYLGENANVGEGFAPASSLTGDDTEYVVMEPIDPSATEQRRVVVVSNGRAVAIQG